MNASTTSFQKCIEGCHACLVACNQSLKEEDVKAMAPCIKHDLECAATCELEIQAMAQHNSHVNAVCRLCAGILPRVRQRMRQALARPLPGLRDGVHQLCCSVQGDR